MKPGDTVERCGVILSNGKILTAKNIALQPELAFEIPPDVMIQPGVVGTWHTHPVTIANLSSADREGFLNWPHLTHWIVGTDGVRSYTIEEGMVING